MLLGLSLLSWLAWEKVSSGYPGFLNPYSFLLSISLVAFGFQILIFGFMANLFLQLRRSVEYSLSLPIVQVHQDMDESNGK